MQVQAAFNKRCTLGYAYRLNKEKESERAEQTGRRQNVLEQAHYEHMSTHTHAHVATDEGRALFVRFARSARWHGEADAV